MVAFLSASQQGVFFVLRVSSFSVERTVFLPLGYSSLELAVWSADESVAVRLSALPALLSADPTVPVRR